MTHSLSSAVRAAHQLERSKTLEDEEYIRRAIAAWFRSGAHHQPRRITVEEHERKCSVVLRYVNGRHAVYRIRDDEILMRLKWWPEEVEQVM